MRSFFITIAVFILSVFISSTVSADNTYVIRKGDNPYTIAKKFKVSSRDIIKANGLKPDNLKPGTRIAIPDKAEHLRKGKTSKNRRLVQSRNKKVAEDDTRSARYAGNSSFHIVRRGETLSSIAKKSNIDLDELRNINGLETDLLRPGQKILLEPEQEVDDTRNYEALLSRAHAGEELEKASESKELGELGIHDRLILFAKKMLDIPYRFGGNSLFGIDCSAYVKKVYSLIGVDLPRSAREQFNEGKPVDGEELSMGDLVFFRTYATFPSHVGIYLGNNLFIHASSRSKKVTIDSLETPYYLKRFIGAKRLLELKGEKENQPGEG